MGHNKHRNKRERLAEIDDATSPAFGKRFVRSFKISSLPWIGVLLLGGLVIQYKGLPREAYPAWVALVGGLVFATSDFRCEDDTWPKEKRTKDPFYRWGLSMGLLGSLITVLMALK